MRRGWLGLLCVVLTATALSQQPAAPTLDTVLTSVQHNFAAYLKEVPNLYADEHVLSTVRGYNHRDSTTDSVFSLRRVPPDSKHIDGFAESREIKTVDKQTATGDELSGPSVLWGVFSTGQQDFATNLKDCFDYNLRLDQKWQKKRVLVVTLALKPGAKPSGRCPIAEPVTGKAVIDPQTMQVLAVEEQFPDHPVYRSLHGEWLWSVEYAPVELDGKAFWLPEKITSVSLLKGQQITPRQGPLRWSFEASYRNYHLLTVNSKILPGTTVKR